MSVCSIRKRVLIPLLLVELLLPGSAPASRSESSYEEQIGQLANHLAENVQKSGKKTVAVIDFTNLSGDVIELGRFLAEELSVALAQKANGFEVIDRTYLKAILEEHKLVSKGFIDPLTARKLGQIAGVDGLITGTITPFGDSVRLSVEVLDVSTAKVLGAASTDIAKTKAIEELLSRNLSGEGQNEGASLKPSSAPPTDKNSLPRERQAPAVLMQQNDFNFQVSRCHRSTTTVSCMGKITNKGSSMRHLWFEVGSSYLVDELGNQYSSQDGKFAMQLGAQGTEQDLEPDLAMTFGARAESVSPQASSMNLVLVYGFYQRDPAMDKRSIRLSLRNVPIQ